jgi:SOS response regulatory protein OraA/RecX
MPEEWELKQKERAKRGRFMSSRGFAPSHFMHLLEATSDE